MPYELYIGILETSQAKSILSAVDTYAIEFEFYLPAKAADDTDSKFVVVMDLYGACDKAESIGRSFSRSRLYLQDPFLNEKQLSYYNPQGLVISTEAIAMLRAETSLKYNQATSSTEKLKAVELQRREDEICDSFNVENLGKIERIRTSLKL